jgi:hypothetical protein
VSHDERAKINEAANALRVSVSKYLRDAAIGRSVRRIEDMKALICLMGRACGNLHALAKYANFNKSSANQMLILSTLKKIESEIDCIRQSL